MKSGRCDEEGTIDKARSAATIHSRGDFTCGISLPRNSGEVMRAVTSGRISRCENAPSIPDDLGYARDEVANLNQSRSAMNS
jgi:hypothetical protein